MKEWSVGGVQYLDSVRAKTGVAQHTNTCKGLDENLQSESLCVHAHLRRQICEDGYGQSTFCEAQGESRPGTSQAHPPVPLTSSSRLTESRYSGD